MAWKSPTEEQLKARFKNKIKVSDSGCWEWQGALRHDGYGKAFMPGPIEIRAHRMSYKLFVGELPLDKMVCHHCDNRKCVNPDHLFLGTHDDNMKDGVKKRRFCSGELRKKFNRPRKGENHPNSKLTEDKVKDIIALSRIGWSYREIAKYINANSGTVWDVVKNKTWKHICREVS